MNQPAEALAPVHKSISVPVGPDRAFDFYTAGVQEWWPLGIHSVGQADAVGIVFGTGVGEQIVETMADGATHVWGTIVAWDPPHRVAHTWHAGSAEEEATDVEVTFTPDGADGTRVELTHTGWERRRGDAAGIRAGYVGGWDTVLAAYVSCAR
jgi:uncharacterized protein YndB with AHSA1/START domain